ncbi:MULTISPECIES: hypothetical protein [Bacillus]|uniref:hypothetical protein n=1 Tax=Bacillus TaxID=1386 RepID=UPI0002F2029D|nr:MULTISPECIES: hypothetical protein [Bacillus]
MVFDYVRPIFIFLLIFSIFTFCMIWIRKNKMAGLDRYYIFCLSFLCIAVSGMLSWQTGMIVDDLNMNGDGVSFILFLCIFAINIVNVVFSLVKKKREDV